MPAASHVRREPEGGRPDLVETDGRTSRRDHGPVRAARSDGRIRPGSAGASDRTPHRNGASDSDGPNGGDLGAAVLRRYAAPDAKGLVPGQDLLGHLVVEQVVHAGDMARAAARPLELPAVALGVADRIVRGMDERILRQPGMYGHAVPAPPNAGPADRLAAFLGRAVDPRTGRNAAVRGTVSTVAVSACRLRRTGRADPAGRAVQPCSAGVPSGGPMPARTTGGQSVGR